MGDHLGRTAGSSVRSDPHHEFCYSYGVACVVSQSEDALLSWWPWLLCPQSDIWLPQSPAPRFTQPPALPYTPGTWPVPSPPPCLSLPPRFSKAQDWASTLSLSPDPHACPLPHPGEILLTSLLNPACTCCSPLPSGPNRTPPGVL